MHAANSSSGPRAPRDGADIRLIGLRGVPLVRAGDDLLEIVLRALRASDQVLHAGDVLVVAQKIVSKAEGRCVALRSVEPSPRALDLAVETGKDARLVQLILQEAREVLRSRPEVLIVEQRLGFVMANAGVDQSNVQHGPEGECALLLPLDPDATAQRLSASLMGATGCRVPVIINDSHGRAWRNGTVGVAIGAAGLEAIRDRRGDPDLYGRPLRITQVGWADEIAAAASLVMGQGDEGRPLVLVRGLESGSADGRAADLIRPRQQDLFR
jgi:coenzyme F420-0:L-glutamate ligase/coenzyme F420-1:gamma-L-glutamate ligase